MLDPDINVCPRCATHVSCLSLKIRTKEINGVQEFAGRYVGCECNSLTMNGQGRLNLIDEDAELFGVTRKLPKTEAQVLARIAPTMRRRS